MENIPSINPMNLGHQDSMPQDANAIQGRIRAWLNPTQYADDGSEYQKHCSSHAEGTGQWFLQSPIFQEWRESDQHGLLRIRGIPGSGKSVIASEIIKHLTEEEDCPILYFFFRHTIETNNRPEAAIRDWLAQVLQFSPVLQDTLTEEMSHPVETLPMFRLYELLRAALESVPKIFCVLDALDEMEQHVLLPFLDVIDQIGSMQPGLIKVVFTCRPIFGLERNMRDMSLLDISLASELVGPDINTYLRARLAQTNIAEKSHSEIVDKILAKGHGLFLYAKLAIDTILRAKTGHLEAIERLPVQLSIMYDDLLKENIYRTGISEELHLLVLKLVTHATRPLRLLAVVDCIKTTQPQYGDDVGKLKVLVRTICGPLLEILPDETIRVVHHSLTEHLLGITRGPDHKGGFPVFEPGPTHNQLALICLKYLSSGCLDLVIAGKTTLVRGQIYLPFTSYAASNWLVHLTKAAAEGHDQQEVIIALEKLLIKGSEGNLKKIRLFAKLTPLGLRDNGEELRLEAAVLLLAVELDLLDFVEHLLKKYGNELTEYDESRNITPCLHLAIRQNNERIVRLLLQYGADINQYDSGGRTPLHIAVQSWSWHTKPERPSNPMMIKTLLGAGADPWKKMGRDKHRISHSTSFSFPPIMSVFYANDVKIAEIFLSCLNSRKMVTQALFWIFAGSANMDVAQRLLLHSHFDINTKGPQSYCQMTPLFMACRMRDPLLIKLFLGAGANPNIPHRNDMSRKTSHDPQNIIGLNVFHALLWPDIEHRHYGFPKEPLEGESKLRECFRLVVEAGADVNQVDAWGRTAFHMLEDELALECLWEIQPSGINALDRRGNTPLMTILSRLSPESSEGGKLNLVLKLLERGGDPSITNKKGDSALHIMAPYMKFSQSPSREILQKIAEFGIDPNIRDSEGDTPFHKMVVRSVFVEDDYQTFMDITQADFEAKDAKGLTPLFKALSRGKGGDIVGFCQWMKNVGARFDTTDRRGRTLLHAAAPTMAGGGGVLLRFLVDAGVNPSQVDMDGNSIWHAAVPTLSKRGGSFQNFDAITALGTDVTKANNRGRLPLHILSQYHQKDLSDEGSGENKQRPSPPGQYMKGQSLLAYFLASSPNSINSVDNDGVAPLHTACTFSDELTSRLLELGADITLKTSEKLTVFHIAARSKETNILGILIDWFRSNNGNMGLVDFLDARDIQGCTALYYACASGQLEPVKLLLEAGATIDSSTYNGSVWNAVAVFEREVGRRTEYAQAQLIGDEAGHNGYGTEPDCSSVLLSDYSTPLQERGKHPNTLGRIDDIVELLTANASDSGRRFIDEAITSAVRDQRDYTVELLMHARTLLALESQLDCREEANLCLDRRAQLLTQDLTDKFPQYTLYDMTKLCIQDRKYGLIPYLTNEYISRDSGNNAAELEMVLKEIIESGFVSLLDKVLTPRFVSILSGNIQGKHYDPKGDGIGLRPLLHRVLRAGKPNMSVVHVLVEKGAGLESYGRERSAAVSILIGRPTYMGDRKYWWQLHQALPYLLSKGANLEVKDSSSHTLLFLSLEGVNKPRWNSKVTKMLLEAGADPNATDREGKSCLALALGNKAAYQMLLDHGAKISPSVLMSAVDANDLDSLRLMLSSGADPNMRNPGEEVPVRFHGMGMSPERHDPGRKHEHYLLDYILLKSHSQDKGPAKTCMPFLELLLEYGADVNARYQHTSIVECLLKREVRGGDQGDYDNRPWFPMILGHPALDVEARNKDGMTHLLVACSLAFLPAMEMLLDRGADILARDKQDRNALHHLFEHYRSVHYFRKLGPGSPHRSEPLDKILTLAPELIHQVDHHGRTPLLCAVERSPNSHGVETLVSVNRAGVSVANTKTGDTPLHLALGGYWDIDASGDEEPFLFGRTLELMDLFLASGGDINARNLAGETPIFNFFRNGCARFKFQRKWVRSAADQKMEDEVRVAKEDLIMELLDQTGVDWCVTNTLGQSLLHIIAGDTDSHEYGHVKGRRKAKRFQFVMGKGLDVLAEDMEHRTPLDFAAVTETEEILDMFKKQ